MRVVLASTRKDLARLARDWPSVALWAGIPLAIGLLLFLAFGREGTEPQAVLLVADQDESLASRLLVGAYEQGPLAEMVLVEPVDLAEGREAIEDGKGSALLIVPEGFGGRVLREEPVELTLVRNPAQQILPDILEETLDIIVDGVFYLQQLFSEPLSVIAGGIDEAADTVSDSTVARASVAFNQIGNRVGGYLFPPVIQIETTTADDEEDGFNFGALFLPSMLILSLLFVGLTVSQDIWRERSMGTLRRVATTPQPLTGFLAGKTIAAAVPMALVALVALLMGRWLLGLPLSNLGLAVIWSTLAGTLFYLLLLVVQLYASSEQAGSVLATAVLFPLAMAGGSFFPFEFMPEWMAQFGRLTPNGWALTQLNQLLDGDLMASQLLVGVIAIVLVEGVLFVMAARRVRSRFAVS